MEGANYSNVRVDVLRVRCGLEYVGTVYLFLWYIEWVLSQRIIESEGQSASSYTRVTKIS